MPGRAREQGSSGVRSPVEKAIWFIESHFARDLTLDELAGVCGLSRFQMSRLFSNATGMTVTAYVRGRRRTEAARVLASGAPDILPVALKAGYGSHEAFLAPSATSSGSLRPR